MWLVLSSLNTVTKESAIEAMILGRTSPHPGVGPQVELSGRHASSLFDLFGIGKTLASQRIAAQEPPPALLQIEPARSGRNEDVMEARMIEQPGARLEAGMTTEMVSDDEQVAFGVVGFDVGQKRDVALRRCAKPRIWSIPSHHVPAALHRPRSSPAHARNPWGL
jgi:hypothetical protein